MPITRARKEEVTALLAERFAACESAVLVDYRGLSVAELQAVRRELKTVGSTLQVASNRLLRLALANNSMSCLSADGTDLTAQLLTGPTAVTFGYDQPNLVAELLLKMADQYAALELKGGFIGAEPVAGAAGVQRIAKMRSKVDYLANVVSILKGAPRRVRMVAGALPRTLTALKQLKQEEAA
ncbi:MAG: 50S ribosomal protein L10 [Armatimonadetes bacterium]|nr:50S ribosomal protein L10 [Armatimonadota bacterium]